MYLETRIIFYFFLQEIHYYPIEYLNHQQNQNRDALSFLFVLLAFSGVQVQLDWGPCFKTFSCIL